MSNPMKEQVTDELKKAQEKGELRFKKIRDIFKTAFEQTITELKEAKSEIRPHIKDAGSAVVRTFDRKTETVANTNEEQGVSPVVVDIVGEDTIEEPVIAPIVVSEDTNQEVAITPEVLDSIPVQEDTVGEGTSPTSDVRREIDKTNVSTRYESLLKIVVDAIKEGNVSTVRQQLAEQFKAELQETDVKLSERYGDRYAKVKQYLQNAKVRYLEARAKMDAGETSVLQRKQVEIDAKCAQAGISAAKKEAEIKQQVKAVWQAIGTKS